MAAFIACFSRHDKPHKVPKAESTCLTATRPWVVLLTPWLQVSDKALPAGDKDP